MLNSNLTKKVKLTLKFNVIPETLLVTLKFKRFSLDVIRAPKQKQRQCATVQAANDLVKKVQ